MFKQTALSIFKLTNFFIIHLSLISPKAGVDILCARNGTILS